MDKRPILFLSLILILSQSLTARGMYMEKERDFLIEEKMLLSGLPDKVTGLRIWIPYPPTERNQSVTDFKLTSSFDTRIIRDKKYGNQIIYLTPRKSVAYGKDQEIILSYRVKRREAGSTAELEEDRRDPSHFLKPDRHVPVGGEFARLAATITKGKTSDLERVKAIYDYIIDEFTYTKDDPKVCGLGDSIIALRHKKGICTDYHSLFLSLVRSLGIPAAFEIGFRLPEDEDGGEIKGYHCWAKFYLKDKGWIPVDISEADKHPEKRDYFFGRIDENRVHLVSGRDIRLAYAREVREVNFFVYPYAEIDGGQFINTEVKVRFKELKGGDKTAVFAAVKEYN